MKILPPIFCLSGSPGNPPALFYPMPIPRFPKHTNSAHHYPAGSLTFAVKVWEGYCSIGDEAGHGISFPFSTSLQNPANPFLQGSSSGSLFLRRCNLRQTGPSSCCAPTAVNSSVNQGSAVYCWL